MPSGWIRLLPMLALLLGTAVTVSGCNTVSGTLNGVGQDISMIGNTLSSVSGDDNCLRDSCGKLRYAKNCGRQGCRQLRSVTTSSSCARGGCGRNYGYRQYGHREYGYRGYRGDPVAYRYRDCC